jgi:hypothetical protein
VPLFPWKAKAKLLLIVVAGEVSCFQGVGDVMEDVPVKRSQRLGVFYQCAQCGAPVIAETLSEYVGERPARNVWSCDACGYHFETASCVPKIEQAA